MGNSGSPDSALMVQWFFGGLVVVFYAVHRFNEPRQDPRPARATTTFWRYWSACGGYVIAMLGLFIVLGGGLASIDPRMLLSLVEGGTVPAEARSLPGPLLSAMILTSLLPHFPGLGKIDASVKRWFQDVGNIPWEVRELSRFLKDSGYAPQPEALTQIHSVLRSFGVDEAWLREPTDTLKHRWARSVALYGQVQRWEASRGFARYVDQHRTALPDIRERIEKLAEFLDARTLAELDGSGDSRLVAHSRKIFDSELGALQDSLCNFISGGVLEGARNHASRRDALVQLGFSGLPATRGPLTSHDIVLVAGLVFLAMLFVPLMMRRFIDPLPLPQNLRILVTVPIVYAIAIVAAIYPKSVWPFAARQAGGERPFAAYAVSGVVAAAASFAVSLVFRFVFDKSGNIFQSLSTPGAFPEAWATTLERWPWLLMTFFITVAVAWAADDMEPADHAGRLRLRAIEAAALALVLGVIQWTVLQILIGASPEAAARFGDAVPRMMVTAVAVGACIGWLVPAMHRARNRGRIETAPMPALAMPG
ncbi:MAG: hypothetical protein K8R60_12755 [Burkholderiales bacterium]|nr:hypothetical protein [Burkholderiales bacterium]